MSVNEDALDHRMYLNTGEEEMRIHSKVALALVSLAVSLPLAFGQNAAPASAPHPHPHSRRPDRTNNFGITACTNSR
jgi:hypothetical protein